jgi:hypothetical protein
MCLCNCHQAGNSDNWKLENARDAIKLIFPPFPLAVHLHQVSTFPFLTSASHYLSTAMSDIPVLTPDLVHDLIASTENTLKSYRKAPKDRKKKLGGNGKITS